MSFGVWKKAVLTVVLAALLATVVTVADPGERAEAATPVVPINPNTDRDVITYLTAGGAERSDGFTEPRSTANDPNNPKYFWLTGWDSPDQYLRWTVSAPWDGDYQVKTLFNATARDGFEILIDGQSALQWNSTHSGFVGDRAGILSIPAGEHTLTLRRTGQSRSGRNSVKSLELIRTSVLDAYNERVKAFHIPDRNFLDDGFGVMFQLGQWGTEPDGTRKSLDQTAADFDVDAFVEKMVSTRADYVVWSVSWWTFELLTPSTTVDRIMGNGSQTAERDLIGEIAAGLKAKDINFYVYYHTGQSSHMRTITDWWAAQNFPGEHALTGGGDKSTFFKNWEDVVSELGQRWGTNLDGWFFDDGLIYYPAPFEELAEAARAGNPNRLISFNEWRAPNYTDFENVDFGEECRITRTPGDHFPRIREGFDGYRMSQCMNVTQGTWGLFSTRQRISAPTRTIAEYTRGHLPRANYGAISLAMLMYNDGSTHPETLKLFQGLGASFAARKRCGFGCSVIDPATVGTPGWAVETGRNIGDSLNKDGVDDVLTASSNASTLKLGFEGTGIRVVAPTGPAAATFTVSIDGGRATTVKATSAEDRAQMVLFERTDLSPGSHTIAIKRATSGDLRVDYLEVLSAIKQLDDQDPAVTYNGTWQGVANTDAANQTLTRSTTAGDTMSFTFTGTDIQLTGPVGPDYEPIEVVLDGKSKGDWVLAQPDNESGQVLFEATGLANQAHTVEVINKGSLAEIDQILINGQRAVAQPTSDPVIVLAQQPPASVSAGDEISLDASESQDPAGGALKYVWTVNGGTVVSRTSTFTATPQAPGQFRIELQVTNDKGLRSTRRWTVQVTGQTSPQPDKQYPLIVLAQQPPASAAVGTEITLDASASNDPDGGDLRYVWTTNEGKVVSRTSTATVTRNTPGQLRIQLQIVDDEGVRVTQRWATRFESKYRPEAVLSYSGPNTIRVGTAVTFDGSSSANPAGGTLRYLWRTNGGVVVSREANLTVIPQTTGRLGIQLLVIDENNQVSYKRLDLTVVR